MFKWLFQELLINLNLMRNNELVKFLNFLILKKYPALLQYIKNKVRIEEAKLKDKEAQEKTKNGETIPHVTPYTKLDLD